MIFNLIKKHEKSGVILLSGDVHFAQFYETKCKSLTGYNVPELTSSGMSHHVDSFFKGMGQKLLPLVTPKFWSASDLIVDFNFGLIKIAKTQGGDIEVNLEVRDHNNKIRLAKTLSKNKDLKFNNASTQYSKMCLTAHSENKVIIQINHYFEILVIKR